MNLSLLQISDSALPIGGYTHSWGLEAALHRGTVVDAATLEEWTREWLINSLAPLEGVVVAQCCRAVPAGDWHRIVEANELLEASLAPPTIRLASREMGEQLMALAATWPWSAAGLETLVDKCANSPDHAGWHHPVAFGVVGALAGASAIEALTAYLHQGVLAMVTAGVRAIPVGHTHGQQVVAYLHDEIRALAAALVERPLESAGSGCPFYELLCDEQTQLYARMFRS